MKKAILLAITASVFVGCVSSIQPLESGYSLKYVAYPLIMDGGGGRSLYFRPTGQSRRLLWKYVPGTVLVHDTIVVFIGVAREKGSQRGGGSYLAAHGSGPVLMISQEILRYSARRDGLDPTGRVGRYGDYLLRKTDDGIEAEFSAEQGVNQPHLCVRLTWAEVESIMRRVRQSGREHRDEPSGMTYLE